MLFSEQIIKLRFLLFKNEENIFAQLLVLEKQI